MHFTLFAYTCTCISPCYLFSSPAEKAYEVAGNGSGGEGGAGGLEGGEHDLGLVGKDNSIFVAAMKEHLQNNRGSLKDAVQTLFNATAKGTIYVHVSNTCTCVKYMYMCTIQCTCT